MSRQTSAFSVSKFCSGGGALAEGWQLKAEGFLCNFPKTVFFLRCKRGWRD
jgi:hypothetical protein